MQRRLRRTGTYSWDSSKVIEWFSLRERAPGGLANIKGRRGQALLYAAITRHGGQCTTAAALVRVEDHPAVGRDRRTFVVGTLRQHLRLSCRVIHDRDFKPSAIAADVHYAFAIRQRARGNVVAAVERHALDGAAGDVDPVDLRRAAAVGGEQ